MREIFTRDLFAFSSIFSFSMVLKVNVVVVVGVGGGGIQIIWKKTKIHTRSGKKCLQNEMKQRKNRC